MGWLYLEGNLAMKSIQGRCLIASPYLVESSFYKTVILLIAHSEEGAMGLILNRPTSTSLKVVLESATKEDCVHDDFLFRGGPVSGPLMAFHNLSSLAETQCVPNVFFTSNGRHFKHLAKLSDIQLRVFDGYSGWGPQQLEGELESGGWIVGDITAEEVFSSSDTMWERMIHQVGNNIMAQSFGIEKAPIPNDPRNN